MKKTIALILTGLILFSLSACGEKPTASEVTAAAETAVPADTPSAEKPEVSELRAVPAPASADTGKNAIDVDLTQLSSTMVYSEVYAMMYEPEQYIGKKVKMNGAFSAWTAEDGETYFACVVKDATACCAQGLEFKLKDSYTYPDDYPQPNDNITVVGTFDTYQEELNGDYYVFLILKDAELL